jgi:membrane protease YdiL (CAAX protease family)
VRGWPIPGPGPAEAVAVLAGLAVLELAVSSAVSVPRDWVTAVAYTGVLRAAETALCFGYWRVRGWSLADWGLSGPKAPKGFAVGAALAAAFAGAVAAAEGLVRLFGGWDLLDRVLGRGGGAEGLTVLLLVGAVVAPIFEEIAFRGILYGSLRARVGPAVATLVATLLFAGAHALTNGVPWVQALGGVVFCIAYELSGSLWAPIVVHASGNAAIFLLPLLLH